MERFRVLFVTFMCAGLAACGTYSATDVKPVGKQESQNASPASSPNEPAPTVKSGRPATDPAKIILTKGDITDRKYQAIGDIKVTVNKATIFDKDPTPALVDEQLRDKAAELGADAVILVRYGTVGVSLFSWGSIDGEGRAVFFVKG